MIIGLDLSARAAAAVVVADDWDGKWSRVKTLVVGEDLKRGSTDRLRALRCGFIAEAIVEFARRHGVTVAYVEGYAFSQHTAAHTIAEVGGCVRLELVRAGIDVHTAMMQSARKLLLGKLPPRGKAVTGKKVTAKEAVVAALRAAGAAFKTVDEYDAFVCANFGMAERGGFFYGQAAA
jgi:hypothetical protein